MLGEFNYDSYKILTPFEINFKPNANHLRPKAQGSSSMPMSFC